MLCRKAIFLDIDGTICVNGIVRTSAITAIQKARENGNKVLLCTGRSLGTIDTNIMEIGFDGIIASAGAYVEVNDIILFHKTLDKNLLNAVIDYCNEYDIYYFLEANYKLYATEERIITNWKTFKSKFVFKTFDQIKNRKDINTISFSSAFRTIEQINEDWEGILTITPGMIKENGFDNGEFYQIGINKATGIQYAIKHLGLTQKATIAVGDGSNDFEMLEYCNIGIAMGNALDELKKVADYITNPINEDGLYNCFHEFGLLKEKS